MRGGLTLLRFLGRLVGLALLVAAMVPFHAALRALDQREFVSALLATWVGWFITQAGVELVRPESAE